MDIEKIPDESREKPLLMLLDEVIDKLNEVIDKINE
tara:strand:- start:1295 stop:1402 length:108 start_codon:yes stop_codon:yes gene_type:complete